MRKTVLILSFLTLLISFSCNKREEPTDMLADSFGTLNCQVTVIEPVQTKSQLNVQENLLKTASIVIYDDNGQFVKSVNTTDMSSISFPYLHIGDRYHLYGLFNCGNCTFPLNESDINTLTATWDTGTINAGGFPMSWSETVTLDSENLVVQIKATRLISKVVFNVDDDGLSGHKGSFTVSSVALKNASHTMCVFGDTQSPQGETGYSSDSATAGDVGTLNSGGSVSFYCFENLGGTPYALSGNTDPWKKVPENTDGKADHCTYLEVTGTYSTDGGAMSVPVTYRMYLGENSTTNFDLMRNCIYRVTMSLSDEGVGRTSWKVTRGDFSDSRKLEFTPASVDMNLNGSVGFTVTPTPSDMEYSLEGGAGFDASTLSIVSTGTANQYSLVSSGTLSADAVTSVKAVSWDGRVSTTMPVTVKAKTLKRIEVSPASVIKYSGQSQAYTVYAIYEMNGSECSPEDVTSQAELLSSNTDVVTFGTGADRHVATAGNGGTAGITAKFKGKEAYTGFRTLYPVSLKVSCTGYQSGPESSPTWKIDWETVPKTPGNVTYTITAVYDDNSERSGVQSLCSATQTYSSGNAGAGNCFVFDKGVITQASTGDNDKGGTGTVKFSFTEAGKTAEITVCWWKLYLLSLSLAKSNFEYNFPQPYSSVMINGRFNDGETRSVGTYASIKGKLGDLVSSNTDYLQPNSSDNKIYALRKGSVILNSAGLYRGARITNQTIYTWGAGAVSSSPTTFVDVNEVNMKPGTTYYPAYVDEDGGHIVTSGGKIQAYHGAGNYYYDNSVTSEQLYQDIIVGEGDTHRQKNIEIWSKNAYVWDKSTAASSIRYVPSDWGN